MTPLVKELIEDNIDKIENNEFEELLEYTYEQAYPNNFVREFVDTLANVTPSVKVAQNECLYNMLSKICADAHTDPDEKNNNLHQLLIRENNWYGYTLEEIITEFKQLTYNLNVQLELTHKNSLFPVDNYLIYPMV